MIFRLWRAFCIDTFLVSICWVLSDHFQKQEQSKQAHFTFLPLVECTLTLRLSKVLSLPSQSWTPRITKTEGSPISGSALCQQLRTSWSWRHRIMEWITLRCLLICWSPSMGAAHEWLQRCNPRMRDTPTRVRSVTMLPESVCECVTTFLLCFLGTCCPIGRDWEVAGHAEYH